MSGDLAAARWRRRPGPVVLALGVLGATLVLAALLRPVPLAEVLLIVLVEVIAVGLVAGRTIAALASVAAFVGVNWLLVPPYGTLQMADQQNWVTLAVFLLLAVGVSTLVDTAIAAERQAAMSIAREQALAEVLRPDEASAEEALRVLRSALHLDVVALTSTSTNERLLSGADRPPEYAPALQLEVAPDYRVLGWGPEVMGTRPDYATTLATAAVRAWESQRLVAEQARSARLAELDAARAALLASIGHDLRTPLAGIRVSADALAMSGPGLSDADRAELLQTLQQSAIRLDGLLDAVLDAARIEAGVTSVRRQDIDLREVVRDALSDLPTGRLALTLPDQPVPARTDPAICARIVANLATNALTHTPASSTVEVTCTHHGDASAVRIIDHGPGLEDDAIDSGRPSHGLGLTIVDRLAGFSGITIQRTGTPGGGLTLDLTFPDESA